MKLMVMGVDHRSAPASVREALAFDGGKLESGLAQLSSTFPGTEAVVISTCNRVEVYMAAENPEALPTADDAIAFLERFHGKSAEAFASHLVHYFDDAAVGHLFRVSSSLESLVLGEGQILGQVRDAYQAAVAGKAVGPIFHAVFQHALRVGKKVREHTELDQGKVSVASVAVDVARDVFDRFDNKTVLVIGAGKMAELTLRHLVNLKPGRILVANRNPDRAVAMAQRWNGQARPFDQLRQALIDADLVISTTAADQPIVLHSQYQSIQKARRYRLSLILDIAIPRDFDAKVGDIDQVLLYNVDDLMSQTERNKEARRQSVEAAQAIIENETAACLGSLRHQRAAGHLQRQLGDYFGAICQRELESLFASRPEFSEADRKAIERMTHRLQNQFLHHPRTALRSAAADLGSDNDSHHFLSTVRRMFGLG